MYLRTSTPLPVLNSPDGVPFRRKCLAHTGGPSVLSTFSRGGASCQASCTRSPPRPGNSAPHCLPILGRAYTYKRGDHQHAQHPTWGANPIRLIQEQSTMGFIVWAVGHGFRHSCWRSAINLKRAPLRRLALAP